MLKNPTNITTKLGPTEIASNLLIDLDYSTCEMLKI